jgi:hypothetical protein
MTSKELRRRSLLSYYEGNNPVAHAEEFAVHEARKLILEEMEITGVDRGQLAGRLGVSVSTLEGFLEGEDFSLRKMVCVLAALGMGLRLEGVAGVFPSRPPVNLAKLEVIKAEAPLKARPQNEELMADPA